MVSDRILNSIKRRTAQFLTETCTLSQEEETTGKYGARTHSFVVVAEDVPCRVITVGSRYSGQIRQEGQQEAMKDVYRLVCPVGTQLTVDMRVEVNGLTYKIINVLTARTDATDAIAVITRVNDG